MTSLQRHIPELALEWVRDTSDELWRQIDGTLCFASARTALIQVKSPPLRPETQP